MNGIGYYGDITNHLEMVYEDNKKKGKPHGSFLDPMTKKNGCATRNKLEFVTWEKLNEAMVGCREFPPFHWDH